LPRLGKNLRGDRFPCFVNLADPLGEPPLPWGDTYYHPILFYLDALVMVVAPPTIAARAIANRPHRRFDLSAVALCGCAVA
jgi:hypothetical protein